MGASEPLAGVTVAVVPGSTWVHLTSEPRRGSERWTLCGLRACDRTPTQWFALAGCADCARSALRQGVDHVADLDDSEVPLVEVLDR